MMRRRVGRWAALAIAVIASAPAAAGPTKPPRVTDPRAAAVRPEPEAPPANLISGDAAHGAALDPVFAHFQLARLACKFTEEKHIALLARPLRSSGAIYYDRDRGVARSTLAPKPERVVVTRTALRIRKGDRSEEIPLDKSKDLKAFALIFPSLLRGERSELERSFDIGLYGSDAAWWALVFTPKTDSLRALVRRVVVIGQRGAPVSLQVVEASGDTTETQLSDLRTNAAVPDAEITAAFGAP
jgi:outer membrane lipoprotein-sorting protein